MFSLPATFTLFNLTVNTFGIFLLFGFILFLFVLWQQGRGDGFAEERLFDLMIISSVSGILFSRALFALGQITDISAFLQHVVKVWTPGYDSLGMLFGVLIPVFIFCSVWKWSSYRILDIFSLGVSLGMSVVALGFVALQGNFYFLFAFSAWIFLFALLTKLRTSHIKSGYAFCIFLLANAVIGLVFFGETLSLIFYLVLVTLSLIVFLFRWRLASYEKSEFVRRIISRIKRGLTNKKG